MIRQAMTKAAFAALVTLALYAPALEARECKGQSDEPLVNMLQPPPCETCPEAKAELEELESLEHARTPEEQARAVSDVKMSVERFLEGAGIDFEPEKLRSCQKFFTRPRQEEKAVIDAAKDTFCRLRPYKTAGNALHPAEEAIPNDSFSYPSGHSAYGATIGFLLVEMLPEKRAEIYRRINDYARNRMIAAVHFRSDVEAGKAVGAAVVARLFAEPDFRQAFDEAKTCVRASVRLKEAAR